LREVARADRSDRRVAMRNGIIIMGVEGEWVFAFRVLIGDTARRPFLE
jgi:hypothetical protein